MNTIALGMSVSSLVVVMGTWIIYLRTIPKMKVPVNPTGSKVLQSIGMGLGGSAIILNFQGIESSGLVFLIPAVFAVLMGGGFFWLLAQRKTPVGDLKVKVGDKLFPFAATTSEGAKFHSDELVGKRILLKFFRGGW